MRTCNSAGITGNPCCIVASSSTRHRGQRNTAEHGGTCLRHPARPIRLYLVAAPLKWIVDRILDTQGWYLSKTAPCLSCFSQLWLVFVFSRRASTPSCGVYGYCRRKPCTARCPHCTSNVKIKKSTSVCAVARAPKSLQRYAAPPPSESVNTREIYSSLRAAYKAASPPTAAAAP